MIGGQRQDVVVKHDHDERARGCVLEREIDGGNVGRRQLAVRLEQVTVVGSGRVEPDDVQPRRGCNGHTPTGHEKSSGVFSQAIVITWDYHHAIAQRLEESLEGVEFRVSAAVGDVTGDENRIDIGIEERSCDPCRVVVGTLVTANVQVGNVGESALHRSSLPAHFTISL
jgi:hypothetical protein